MNKQNKANHTAFSAVFRGGETGATARLKALFAGNKKQVAWPVVCAALLIVFAAGLTACGVHGKQSSSASLVMEMQYYDTLWNIYEVPVITSDESEPAQTINAELCALEEIWQGELSTAYEHVNDVVVAFPCTTDRYLNIVLLQMPPGSGSDGTLYSWVYDKAESRRVTSDEALALAGVAEEELRAQIADSMAAETPYAFTLASVELAGFRIRPDGKPEIYLYGTTEDRTLPGGGELDSWRRLYIWADGALTRGVNLYDPGYQDFKLLIPNDETDATEAPLWCVWAPESGKPAGGFTEPPAAEVTLLTAEELAYFNGDAFFNGEDLNIRNQFLSSLYDAPEQIDLFQLFYCGSGLAETVSEEEKAAVILQDEWEAVPDCACEKISRANMDMVLTEHMGLTLADTGKTGLDQFTYLGHYDAYYHYHDDTNYRRTISFYAGEREGDILRLFYDDRFFGDGKKVLTLKQKDGGCLFMANEKLEVTFFGSSAMPEGIVAESVSVPETVLAAAQYYVQQQYDYWCTSTGCYGMMDGVEVMGGEPASYDKWRIEGMSPVYQYKDLKGPGWPEGLTGQNLDIYRLDYRIHTTTPDKVKAFLAGSMDLDAEGWLLPTYPNATYLIFLAQENMPLYLCSMMANDCQPGDELFTNDMRSRISAALPLGVNKDFSEKLIQDIYACWAFDSDWAFTTPYYNGYGDTWSVGLGQAHEFALGLPYNGLGSVSEATDGLSALTFSTFERCYFDGFRTVRLYGFYGDKPDAPGFSILIYLSTTQPDCKTPRGVHPGDTVETLKKLYPEALEYEDRSEYSPESGIAAHDKCFVYAPKGTNRSILFLTRDDVIVQIDMADGLDGQYESPAWLGVYQEG